MTDVAAALARLATLFAPQRTALEALARIPSCSFAGFPRAPMASAAQAVRALLEDSGFPRVTLMHEGTSFPYVYAEWRCAQPAPTLLFYAHYDVQPAGDASRWLSPPFSPTEREGRLYGRGVADNKAGICALASAVQAWRAGVGDLPLNVKVLIEGEEEVGSPNLPAFLRRHRALLSADALVLADAGNFDTGLPAITQTLRGLVSVDVEVKALTQSLHSGAWGGPVPDAAMALCRMLASLVRADGSIAIAGLTKTRKRVHPETRRAIEALPLSRGRFREQAGLLPGVQLLGGSRHPLESNWHRPSLSVNAIEASSRTDARNILVESAWARVGIRIVPGMDPHTVQHALIEALKKNAPWGVEVVVHTEEGNAAWHTPTEHPAFQATLEALEQGYGQKPVVMGCGASIPIVGAFAESMGGIPALLIGVEDPYTNGHSENESLHLGDFASATRSLVLMFDALSRALRSDARRERTSSVGRATRTP